MTGTRKRDMRKRSGWMRSLNGKFGMNPLCLLQRPVYFHVCVCVLIIFIHFRKLWRTIIFGQILSLLLCISQYISHHLTTSLHLTTPTSQNYLRYILICSVFTTALAFRKGDKGLISVMKTRGYRYVLIGLLDLEAATLVATSHQFSSLINIQVGLNRI